MKTSKLDHRTFRRIGMMLKHALVIAGLCAIAGIHRAQASESDFDFGWRFAKGDFPEAMTQEFDDSNWRDVQLPHDWSVEGPFEPKYASGTGFAPGGVGWYRKHFVLPPEARERNVFIEFDGIYDNATIWLNGQLVGTHPYGYTSFQLDLTAFIRAGDQTNVLCVRVDHSEFSDSRWYTGSGIYRHVRLRITDPLRLAHWGTFVTTPKVDSKSSTIKVASEIVNGRTNIEEVHLKLEIYSPDGSLVAHRELRERVDAGGEFTVPTELELKSPELWSPDAPALYRLKVTLSDNNGIVDTREIPFGIRTFAFDPDTGFSLNGQSMKLKGVCLHHDAGALGAAVPAPIWERRLQILKSLGCNAIRTAHNPPAPELLDLCDRLGFLVMDEAFDEYAFPKNKWVLGHNAGIPSRFGYAEHFEEWSVRDVRSMVARDRNHPSIILWSIGNEIDYPNDPFSQPVLGRNFRPYHPSATNLTRLGAPLAAAVKSLDSTRPVTAALASVLMSDAVGFSDLLDVTGYNYQENRYREDHERYPHRVIFGSENGDSYSAWLAVRDNPFISGQFLWTGIDFLGEAGRWPNRVSRAGLLDLAGFKKPQAWWRQSLWSDEPMVHTFASRGRRFPEESWNWETNSPIRIWVCANMPEVKLELNGKALGNFAQSDFHDGWLVLTNQFEPGTLRAIGLNNGNEVCRYDLTTAGQPKQLRLSLDRSELKADGKDVAQIEFEITDASGTRIPDGEEEVHFSVSGPARIIGIETGRTDGPVDYQSPNQVAFHGRGIVFLRTEQSQGEVRLTASSDDLKAATAILQVH